MNSLDKKMPKGIPYIIGNEAAERYSFYGMKSILFIFLTVFMRNTMGDLDTLGEATATIWVHVFIFAAYGLSIFGAILSDVFWGKYKTIVYLSVIYIIGHFVLALFETKTGFMVGLALIAIGAGGIKPCVSAHVGDQFKEHNKHLIEKMYAYFYFTINAGAIIAYISAGPLLRSEYLIELGINSLVAFGLPGVLMIIALLVFVLGKNQYISVKPAGWQQYKNEFLSQSTLNTLKELIPIYIVISIFFALFDQTSSTWINQTEHILLDKTIHLFWFQFEILPSQLGLFSPLLIIILIPIITNWVYPFLKQKIKFGAIQKISIGLFITALSFVVIYYVQIRLDSKIETSVLWQILAYLLLTIGEIFVSITALEFAYTQAPPKLKSLILSFYLLSVALGNLIVIISTLFLENEDGSLKMEWSNFFLLYSLLMFITFFIFRFLFKNYKEKNIVQNSLEIE